MKYLAVTLGVLLVSASAPVPRGAPATLDIVNAGSAALECHAVAGHWYGFDLGDIAAGAHRAVALLYDRPSGVIAIDNARGRAVPLEFVYCGQQGDAWRTRAVLPLRPALDRAAPVTCRAESGALRCGS